MSRCDGVVVGLSGDEALVELPPRSAACGNCEQAGSCSEGTLMAAGPRRYQLPNRIGARIGDRVELNIEEGSLWRASFGAYLLPLLLALAAAAVGQPLGGDVGAVAGLVVGLMVGLGLLRRRELQLRRNSNIISLQFPTREIRFKEPT